MIMEAVLLLFTGSMAYIHTILMLLALASVDDGECFPLKECPHGQKKERERYQMMDETEKIFIN